MAALHALSRMPAACARYEYHVVDLLRDEVPPVAAAACLAVGEVAAATTGNSSTARAVAELLEHPHPTVRARAVQSLGKMGDEAHAHIETFVSLFGDRAWNVQAEAIRAVAKCGELGQMFAPDVCRMTYQGIRPEVQVAACEALARMGTRGSSFREEVQQLEEDPEQAGVCVCVFCLIYTEAKRQVTHVFSRRLNFDTPRWSGMPLGGL